MSENVLPENKNVAQVLAAHVKNGVNYEHGHATKAAAMYAEYVTVHEVTEATVGKHVKVLTILAYGQTNPSAKAAPGTIEYRAHTYGCKIRKGLKTALGVKATPKTSRSLITPLGATSSLADVIAAWEAAQA